MAKEILLDEPRPRHRRRVFRRERPAAGAAGGSGDRLGGAVESARLLLNSKTKLFPNGLGNRYDWVGRNLQGHTYAGAAGCSTSRPTTTSGRAPASPSAITTTATPAWCGGAMLANEFIRLPYPVPRRYAPPGVPRWGTGAQGLRAAVLPAHRSRCRGRRRRCRCSMRACRWTRRSRTTGAFRWRASPGDKHPHTIEIGSCMAGQGEEWLKEAGAMQTWQEAAGPGVSRRPAPGRHLPHGQRSEDLRGESVLPDPRRGQRLCGRRQRARHQRRLQSGADDHGGRLPGVRRHRQDLERNEVPLMKLTSKYLAMGCGVVFAGLLAMPGAPYYYQASGAKAARAVMRSRATSIRGTPHRTAAINCTECHGEFVPDQCAPRCDASTRRGSRADQPGARTTCSR